MTLRRVIAGALRPLLRIVPAHARLPILTGPLRGRRWIAGAATHGCWIGTYERDAQRVFVEHVRPGDVVFDIGANAGFFTLLASKLTGSSGVVYAFEPLPRNLELLREHIRLNGAGNVQVVPVALSDRAGVAQFDVASNPAMGSLSGEGALEVRTVRLDELGLPLPSLIKMDVEGGEHAALRGAENLLRAARPTILLSMHGHEQSERCSELLRGAGYQLSVLTDGESDGNYVVVGIPIHPREDLESSRERISSATNRSHA